MIFKQWYKRLNIQLVFLLTLALFPLGSVAIYQTHRVATEADRTTGLGFLGLTERAARSEQVLIDRAIGAARLFGSIVPDLLETPEGCAPILSRFVQANPNYSFVGVLPLTGGVSCASSEDVVGFTDLPSFSEAMIAQEPVIAVNRGVLENLPPAFVVAEPFDIDGTFGGFVLVSIPFTSLPDTARELDGQGLVELITFNEEGVILTTRSGFEAAASETPADRSLESLFGKNAQTFRTQNTSGVERRYSIVPIGDSPANVMAIWIINQSPMGQLTDDVAPVLFPALMWIASMGVAMLAMQTLVLRHLQRLRLRMDAFRETRLIQIGENSSNPFHPLEIEDLERNFALMSEDILREEAALEGISREKSVLVKEIHHRVKNNLQLISSIMNMQIRSARHDETRDVLRRLQDRVLSLATIHRDLYQSQDGGRVNAGALVTEIVENSIELASADGGQVNLHNDIEPLRLYPDQAVPLSLLVAEAITNAMKYLGDTRETPARVEAKLTQDDGSCVFSLSNSTGEVGDLESTGLGAKLMKAFALQLGGRLDVQQTPNCYTLTLTFNVSEFEPEARDF